MLLLLIFQMSILPTKNHYVPAMCLCPLYPAQNHDLLGEIRVCPIISSQKKRMLCACRAKGVGLPDATISSQPQEVQQEEPPTWSWLPEVAILVDENTRWNCYWLLWWLVSECYAVKVWFSLVKLIFLVIIADYCWLLFSGIPSNCESSFYH